MANKKTADKIQKRPRPGQPTRYREEYCLDVIDHMKTGGSLGSFGAYLGEKYGRDKSVCEDTVYEWIKVVPQFSEAVRVAKAHGKLFYERIGKQGITGQLRRLSAEEPIIVDRKPLIGPDGQIQYKRKYDAATFNGTTFNFFMQNLFGWQKNVNHTGEIKKVSPMGEALKNILSDPELSKAAREIAKRIAVKE